ncbi:MAG: histidine kinase [Bacteroidota bacterium]|nr:histidine kinase [Bacteroidota bacterium]
MNKRTIYWTCQLGGWLFFVLMQSLFFNLNDLFTSGVAISQFMLLFFGVFISHIYRNFIIRLDWLRFSVLRLIPRVIISSAVCATFHEYIQYGCEIILDIAGGKHATNVDVIINIGNLAFVYFFWSLIYFLFHFIENYKKAEIENLKWEASINEIELNKLKSQLNPHFMFNAMNSIRALVDEDPAKSKEAITQLSNILRNTLQMGKNKVISFEEEMFVVNDYLQLEAIRYEERLKTLVTIHPLSKDFLVPPLMIQTLVENGIKHGISKLTHGGMLEIKTDVKDELLFVYIMNSGQLREASESESGFGIKNTVQRLQLLYGKAASLSISNEDGKVVTELIIPKKILQFDNQK